MTLQKIQTWSQEVLFLLPMVAIVCEIYVQSLVSLKFSQFFLVCNKTNPEHKQLLQDTGMRLQRNLHNKSALPKSKKLTERECFFWQWDLPTYKLPSSTMVEVAEDRWWLGWVKWPIILVNWKNVHALQYAHAFGYPCKDWMLSWKHPTICTHPPTNESTTMWRNWLLQIWTKLWLKEL